MLVRGLEMSWVSLVHRRLVGSPSLLLSKLLLLLLLLLLALPASATV